MVGYIKLIPLFFFFFLKEDFDESLMFRSFGLFEGKNIYDKKNWVIKGKENLLCDSNE